MKVVEWLKGMLEAVMDWLGMANRKIEEVQEYVDEIIEDVTDKVDDVVDTVQEEIEEAKSMLDRATDEEK